MKKESNNTVFFVVGTRPEIIKIAPVVQSIQSSDNIQYELIHTNQHYDENMSNVFFEALDLPPPNLELGVGSGTHAEQTATTLKEIERIIDNREPDMMIAQGDTNSVLSTALAASKRSTEFGHIEAGLRSGDTSMPEETNRIVADHTADLLFSPNQDATENLITENIKENVYITGNTVVDVCLTNVDIANRQSEILDQFNLGVEEYIVATIHRPHNTDEPDRLRQILTALGSIKLPAIMPVHPRTIAAIRDLSMSIPDTVRIIDPLSYFDFLKLLNHARAVVTDSGGVQEEASILEVPCLTVRPNTERPETIKAGVNELVKPTTLAHRLAPLIHDDTVHKQMTGHPYLYGEGTAGDQIVEILHDHLE